MKPAIVALTGLSGVGKSTLLTALAGHLPFQQLQASTLIRRGREVALGQMVAHDHLRHADLDENQMLLIRGLEASIEPDRRLVVLDSHTLIEQEAETWSLVEPAVFAAVGIRAMIFLRDEAVEIEKRRARDHSRNRPRKSAAVLHDIQVQALTQAELICRTVGVPLHLETPSNIHGVATLLREVRGGGEGS